MIKRIITILLAAVMLACGVVTFAACDDQSAEELMQKINEYTAQLQELQTENEGLKNQLQDMEEDLEQANTSQAEKAARIEELQAEKEGLEGQLQDIRADLEQANISQEEYAARIEELQSEKEEIESQLRYLYENEDDITYNVAGGFYEYEVDDMVSLVNWSPTSGLMNSVVIFNGKYEDMTFESTIDTGKFMVNNNPGYRRVDENYTSVSNETFYWAPGPGLTEHAFMDTIAKSGDKIVGYSIIEITLRQLSHWAARVVKSAYVYDFENDEGITYEQVKAAIYETKIGLPYGRVLTFDREAVNYNEEIELYELEVDDLIVEGPTTNSVTIKYNDPYTQFYGELDLGYMGYTRIMSARKMNYLPGDSIYWHHSKDLTGTGEAYIDLIIKSEEKIIGYAVVKVDYWGETEEEQGHSFTVLKSVLFPALDGIFQKVTEEQVRSAINQVKGSVT